MTINTDGSFDPDDKAVILDSMMADAKERFGEDLKDDDLAVIRLFYDPVAERLAESQVDIAAVLRASQIRNADGENLDLLAEQIGVTRIPARKATGTARFSRGSAASVDYTIPEGTVVQTDSTDPAEFQTTVSTSLPAGQTFVDVNIESTEGGIDGNVGANTITVMRRAPTGIEDVTNPAGTAGGAEVEDDEELRARTSKEVGSGSRASVPALVRGIRRVDGVKSVSIFVNDTNTADVDGRDPHSFELVVEGGNPAEVADQILEIKAAGDTSVGGFSGTAVVQEVTLPNGQPLSISYSNPAVQNIWVDVGVKTTDEYAGADVIRDEVVSYIGGLLTSGNEVGGDLGVGDDVVIGEVEFAVRSAPGIYDVEWCNIAVGATPTASDNVNLEILSGQKASSDATDGTITITTTQA